MKRILFFLVLLCIFSGSIKSQSIEYKQFMRTSDGGCRASEGDKNVYIPPPTSYYEMKRKRSNPACKIAVKYSGFSDQAKAAFQYAIDIWQSTLKSPVTINIEAYWVPLETNVLGSCAPYSYCKNFENAPQQNVLYPVALAEKLSRKDQNYTGNADLVIRFNSTRSDWYYGTDGRTPSKQYDLASIVLHEIAHGLGFTGGGMSSTSYIGEWFSKSPYIFDTYMVNKNGQSVYNTALFASPSPILYNQFCSGNLHFVSPLVLANNNNEGAKLYSPTKFESGSSLYHLDETYYPAGNANSLMSPNIGTAEAIHDPGVLLRTIFAEMDWFYTYISHTPLKDSESLTEPFSIKAQINSDVTYLSESVKVHYSYDNFTTESTQTMSTSSIAEEFIATIPATQKACVVNYYIEVTDTYKKRYAPNRPANLYYSFNVGADNTPPTLIHTALECTSSSNSALDISSQVRDNMGINTVSLLYKINTQAISTINLTNDSLNYYNGKINLLPFALKNFDTIYYQIVAQDISSFGNQTTMPSPSTYYKVGVLEAIDAYTNNFTATTIDFTGNDFTVKKMDGFTKPVLYCSYINAGEANFKDYITQLKYPIRLRADTAWMQFDEVVLVEPSEVGAKFGDPDYFYDYVIAEGSKDFGKTWIRFIDGYNSRLNNDWLVKYRSEFDTREISSAKGNASLLKRRTINLYTKNNDFKAGDEILIRFRLYSDPYGYGWGWAIDSLKIQQNILKFINDKVNTVFQNANISIYPNPAQDVVTIDANFGTTIQTLEVNILNVLGNSVYKTTLEGTSNRFYKQIETSHLAQGMYFITLTANGSKITQKLVKK